MINTRRLSLRPIQIEYAEAMYDGLCDDQLYVYLPEGPPNSLQELKERYHFLQDAKSKDETEIWLNWIIFKKREAIPIGYVQATINVATL